MNSKGFGVYITYKYTRGCNPRTENTATRATTVMFKNEVTLNKSFSENNRHSSKRTKGLTKTKKCQKEHNSCNDNKSQSSAEQSTDKYYSKSCQAPEKSC